MIINGLQKLTLLDYPGQIACTVFLGGCNLRCPFCHNGSLALGRDENLISVGELFDFLKSRVGRLGGVCVSGGEPTLHSDLPWLLREIKSLGFSVKLDTNGTNPEMLAQLISDGLVDYVAMDIKNSPDKYALTVGMESADQTFVASLFEKVCASAELLMQGRVDFEFRTTLVKELHGDDDIISIGKWLSGEEKYFLQTYRDEGDLLVGGFSSYNKEETEVLLSILRRFIPNAEIR